MGTYGRFAGRQETHMLYLNLIRGQFDALAQVYPELSLSDAIDTEVWSGFLSTERANAWLQVVPQ